MTDIVGNETLRSLWETMADRCANRDFMVFENRVGSVLNTPTLSSTKTLTELPTFSFPLMCKRAIL